MPPADVALTPEKQEALQRLGEAAVSASVEVLSDLVLRTVRVSSPTVTVLSWGQLDPSFERPMLVVRVEYTGGVQGSNLLVVEAEDARIIAAMMMGEELTDQVQLDELHMSALAEAMNQMMGSTATALSSLLGRRIEMSPPVTVLRPIVSPEGHESLLPGVDGEALVMLSFPIRIDDDQMGSVESRVLQIFPAGFALRLAEDYLAVARQAKPSAPSPAPPAAAAPSSPPAPKPGAVGDAVPPVGAPVPASGASRPSGGGPGPAVPPAPHPVPARGGAAPWSPPSLDDEGEEERLSLEVIKRITVPVTVRLGQAHLPLRDVLSLTRGSIVPLDVADGQPVDVLASGTLIARGEVVVVKEHFGVRITELVRPDRT